ncbi:hypothetical protein B296_00005723, partial [Ensete ventricosum]
GERGGGGGGWEQTGVELVLGFASLDEDFEVDEAERHETERETGHEAGEHDETDADHKVHPEHHRAARLIAPSRRHPGLCLLLLLPLYPAPCTALTISAHVALSSLALYLPDNQLKGSFRRTFTLTPLPGFTFSKSRESDWRNRFLNH